MNKKRNNSLFLIITILVVSNIYFIVQANIRGNIIDKLEEEIKEKKEKIQNNKTSLKELEYRIEYYEEMYGKYNFEKEEVEEYSNIKQITYAELEGKIKEKESFVLLVSQTYCSHCITYKPTYNNVLKENKIIGYDIDLLTLSDEDYTLLMNLTGVSGTPTTLLYNKGEEIKEARMEGSKSKEDLTKVLKDYKFIKE